MPLGRNEKMNAIKESGFETFRRGAFGNAGQNLYVSRAGTIQRIHHFDINGDGYIDLPFANSHDDDTRVPVYIYRNPAVNGERLELPTDGGYAAAMGDINGDGYDDLVIANQYDGVSNEVYAQVYYGSAEGFSVKRMLKLWAPSSKDVEIGDFNGDGRPDIALISREKLRIFYQGEQGFASGGYTDIDLPHDLESIAAADLDGDGYADLVVRSSDRSIAVYWGGPDGIRADRRTKLDKRLSGEGLIGIGIDLAASGAGGATLRVYGVPARPRLKVVALQSRPHLFVCIGEQTLFIPFGANRQAGEPLVLNSGEAMSAAVGDIRGNGEQDIVLASRQTDELGGQRSWIYWGGQGGYANERRTAVATNGANDVIIGRLSGNDNGCGDIVFCQDKVEEWYSHHSLLYRGSPAGIHQPPIRLETHCALDAFISRDSVGEPARLVFLNHLSNRILGNVPVYIYWGGPDGFSPDRREELPGWAATEVRACDFNDDGHVDLLVVNSNENAMHLDRGSFLYYGGPNGFSENHRVELPTRYNMSSCCADLNRDGYLDLLVVGFSNNELLIFYGSERGFADEPKRIKLDIEGIVFDNPRFMTLADFNRDGWLDLVIPECGSSGKTIILWGGPDGFVASRATLLPSGPTISSRAADLNGNGWLDLIVGGYKGDDPGDPYSTFVYIYWGGPEGFSNNRRTQLPASFAADITIADFNNDGILDIFVSCYHGLRSRDIDSFIYWGGSGGVYSESNRTVLPHHSAAGALAADFDEDGFIDLAVVNHKTQGNHPGMSYVWWNGPEGFTERRVTKLPTFGPHGMTHSDIGNIADRGDEELYESRPIELSEDSRIGGISWMAEIPAKTWVKAQIRTAPSEADLNGAPWIGKNGADSWFEKNGETVVGSLSGKWVQYRLALGAVNSGSTPRVSEVAIMLGEPPSSEKRES
ncbi:VCBS repeat-containing protein [Paenibacillus sp. PAMC21692]|uniref:FG-GAP-like repeat-containing protein n=1 Tax=Paenibacillus sp. PAMC21692 TaxID=2762320 RepID=UPI00164E4C13|nr:VCBS repeat-containing protein [Paenibacillus sp. PAMC21692]QNK57074.1 VCBS repeat-containing protein [Paenibacillus sp. PAMC21692]